MKDFHLKILAIIMIIFGIFGLSTLPFLSIIVQYIDSITGFSSGNGYLTNNMDYLFKSPLIYIGGFFVFSIILAIIYLVYSFFKAKRGWLLMKKIISKYGLIYALVWLCTGLIATLLQPNNIILNFYLGLGILFTLYFFKSKKLKIE